jgi:hypothetical protein
MFIGITKNKKNTLSLYSFAFSSLPVSAKGLSFTGLAPG